MLGEMGARGGQRFDGLALQREAERTDMALLARRYLGCELAGARGRLSGTGDVGHQEAAAGQRGMGQREIRIGLDGARKMGLVAMCRRQQAVDAGDIGVARGGGRSAERQAVSIEKHNAVSPDRMPMLLL